MTDFTPPASPATLTPDVAGNLVQRIRREIKKAVIGQDPVIDQVLVTLLAAGHALIEGVPGVGKTLLARALACSFGGSTHRVQFTPDLMPADVVGHVFYDAASGEMKLRRGPVFTHLLLADEINRAPAKTQAALLEVMQEHQVTLEGESLQVPAPFLVLATQNPIEMEGTYPLPEAQLDRFLMKIEVEYPEAGDELELARRVTEDRVGDALPVESLEAVVDPGTVLGLQVATSKVIVDERVSEYAVRVARATRSWAGVAVGAGPRGGIALIRAARAGALLAGRSFTTPDDVKLVASSALNHRIRMSPDAELEGQTPADVVEAVLGDVEAPRS